MIYTVIALNFGILLLHVFGGGPPTIKPLLASRDMDEVAKMTNYYCWHIVTIVLFMMGAGWLWFLMSPAAIEVAILATLFSIAFMLWSLILVIWKKLKFFQMPQWLLFAISTLLSLFALQDKI